MHDGHQGNWNANRSNDAEGVKGGRRCSLERCRRYGNWEATGARSGLRNGCSPPQTSECARSCLQICQAAPRRDRDRFTAGGRDSEGKQDTQNEAQKDISEIQRHASRRPPLAAQLFCPPNTRPMVNMLHPQPQLPPAPAPPPPLVLVPVAVHHLLQQPGGLGGALFKSKHI